MRVHIGSGSVYLDGWFNVDVPGPNTFLAEQRPDLVGRWGTTEDNYYGKHQNKTQDTLRAGPLDQEYVCDRFGSFASIPVPSWQAEEVLARHSFEHLSITEAHKALDEVDSVLKLGGILRIDVPDHDQSLELFRKTGDEFYKRHLLGPRNNERGYHLVGYTREFLKDIVESHGFVFVAEEPNIHFYPAFCLRFVKPGPRTPVEYVSLPYSIPADWNVAEVGPGNYPFERANVYIDRDWDKLAPLQAKGKRVIQENFDTGFPRVENKQFDYLWCSHVLEHVSDPAKCAATLSRIAKRGTIVLPSAIKEGLFNFEEAEHEWLILPNSAEGGPPIFVRRNREYMKRVIDTDVQKITSRLYRTGPNRNGDEQRYLRQWFYRNESALDVVHHWEGELKLQVIG